MVDFESMAQDISPDSPCGESLEYDPEYAELEIAARGKPEQHFGSTLVPAQEPEWRIVESRAVTLFERTRDLRIAAYLARAETVLEGLPGLIGSVDLIRSLVTRHWEHVHPQLDPDDDNDPMVRMNALAALTDPVGLLRDLRQVAFVSSAIGSCSVRDAEAVVSGSQDEDNASSMSRTQLTALVRAHAAAGGANDAQRAFDAVKALSVELVERVGEHQTIDVGPLLRRLRALAVFHAESVGDTVADGDEASSTSGASGDDWTDAADSSAGTDGGDGRADGSARGGGPAQIRNRDDVVRELDRLCTWLERHDPSNPAPLLLRRAQRLVKMNFLDILRDLAPEGMSSIEKIAGLPSTE